MTLERANDNSHQPLKVVHAPANSTFVQLTIQDLVIKNCAKKVVTLTDLNEAFENFKLKQELRDANLISANIKHKVVNPLRCLAEMAEDAPREEGDYPQFLRTLSTTSNLCLSYVEG